MERKIIFLKTKKLRSIDPRYFQITFQLSFLAGGLMFRDFNLHFSQILGAVSAAIATQYFWIHRLQLKSPSTLSLFLSALITSCGVCLLLRSNFFWVHPVVVSIALSSKFLIRNSGKHIFNPANLAVILALLFLPGSWVSPSQWGQETAGLLWIFILGVIVSYKANSFNICLSFLLSWFVLVIAKIIYLGQPWSHLNHQVHNGALLVFTFFMISDPMTIPNRTLARGIFGFSVALFAFVWQFVFFRPNGFIWALFILSPLVIVLDYFLKAPIYRWSNLTKANT